jgi:hypothetical protein
MRLSIDPPGIARLREYVAPERWHRVKAGGDYRIFGTLYLSELRAALADYDALSLEVWDVCERNADLEASARPHPVTDTGGA